MALVVFFLSGIAATVYQLIWQRMLALFYGADVHSVTLIVASFMAGLGLGSLVGGRVADRLGPRRSLLMFAAAELLVGVFGLLSKTLYYDLLYHQLSALSAAPITAELILFASLLVPTFLMGVSLPLLSRAVTSSVNRTGRTVGSLYGWNTLGAAAGALLGTWALLPALGLEHALWVAAAANLACAAGALAVTHAPPGQEDVTPSPVARADDLPAASAPRRPFWSWALIAGLTGFVALGLEIAWFRLLGVLLKSTFLTFGTLLTVYLAGLGLGGAIGARWVEHSRQPGRTFLLLQYTMTVYAAGATAILAALLGTGQPSALVEYLGRYDPADVEGAVRQLRAFSPSQPELGQFLRFAALYFAAPAALVGLPTFLMGFSFPYLQRAAQTEWTRLGSRVGGLMAANIAGAVLGSTITGWWLLPTLGTSGSIAVLAALGVLLAWPLGQTFERAATFTLGASVVTATAVAAMPSSDLLWARLHGVSVEQAISAEDGNGVSLLKTDSGQAPAQTIVFVNGLGQSWIPYGDIHTTLGALPVLIHPDPQDVAIIGLGSGATAFAAAGRAEVRRVTCIEIIGAQIDTLRRLHRQRPNGGLERLLNDPRFDHRVGDGRAFLLQSSRRFDVIEADALRPTSANAGNLYSREYFQLLLRRLKPGGLAVSWAPTQRTRDTFVHVFPHVLDLGGILIGSNQLIPFDAAVVAERTRAADGYFAAAGIDIEKLIGPYLSGVMEVIGPAGPRKQTGLNTDLFPRDEFLAGNPY